MNPLRDRIAVVTGGGRGIGRAISRRLAAEGAGVVVVYAGNERAAVETVAEIDAAGGSGWVEKMDVADPQAVADGIARIAEQRGRLDILVNNAGISKDNLLLRAKAEEWDQVLDTNLRGAWACSKAAVRIMLKAKHTTVGGRSTGRIVNITSVVGETGNAGQTTYAAAKAGLIGLTRALALEVASRGVTVNAVAPGFITTDMTSALPEKVREELATRIPLGRIGDPGDVAEAVAYLCSDGASYVTGQTIRVNGGMDMR
jgi:3-oxoacyl-[acyl-carrier protein] reductase